MCILIFVGTNGETYYNTAALVSCVQNFPKASGPIVGILKGFAGLSGAILTQIFAMLHAPDHAALIYMVVRASDPSSASCLSTAFACFQFVIPLLLTFHFDVVSPVEEPLLPEPAKEETSKSAEQSDLSHSQ